MANNDELKGKVNEAKGKVTDDESTELKGKIQQGFGKAKDKAKEAADDVAGKINKKIDKEKKISLLDLPRQVYFYIFYQGDKQ